MRIIFCGTPQFAVPSFQALLAQPDFQIVAAITQPDRPRGRTREVLFSPIKTAALDAGIPIHQPEKIRAPEMQAVLESLAPDAVAIIAYGQIIPARLLPIPKFGWINLHASLLPKYRGAAPINWALVNGETATGVTTMRIDAGMDTGDMLLQKELAIGPAEAAPELALRLANLGAPLMVETLRGLAAGQITPQPQNHSSASHAPILKKEFGRIDWSLSTQEIFNRIRGFAPWPGAYTSFRGQSCQIWGEPGSPPLPAEDQSSRPGAILPCGDALFVRCGGTTHLRVLAVQVEGRKRIPAGAFANGSRLGPGDHFGET